MSESATTELRQSSGTPAADVDPLAPATVKNQWWRIGLVTASFLFLWFEVVKHLSREWSLNPQYSYGWAVPFLALFLLWQRWPERPSPNPSKATAVRGLLIALIFVCAFLFLPVRFVAEANPDWRLLSWGLAILAVAISVCFVVLIGGRSWARHFVFPFLFFLVAVPWPVVYEQTVIQGLMRAVTSINVAMLNVIGIPALQHGNVIEVTSGLIGIEEACSGVRSLQATLMISLFLGDLYSFAIGRRIFLVVAGGILAFVCNLIRTALLVWVGSQRGPEGIEGWHDPAGLTILMVCLFGLWFLSLIMRRGSNTTAQSTPIDHQGALVRFPVPIFAVFAIWLLLAEVVVQTWYGLHQPDVTSRWAVSWPTAQSEYKTIPIAPEAAGILHYSDGGGASWSAADGHRWMMYFFRWLPGQTAAHFVKIHRPDICLPASGLTMVRDNGIRLITVNGVNLPVRSYFFEDGGTPLHVFYCYWDARSSYESTTAAQEEDWSPRGRVRAALRGRREMGAQMLEVVVWGCENDVDAESRLNQQLKEIVRPS